MDSTIVVLDTITNSFSWTSDRYVVDVPNPQFSVPDFVNVSVPPVVKSPDAELSYVNEAVLDSVFIPTWPSGNNRSLSSGPESSILAWFCVDELITKSANPLFVWLVWDNDPVYSPAE